MNLVVWAQLFRMRRVLFTMRVLSTFLVFFALAAARLAGQGPSSVAEQYLFNAANAERAQRGMAPLRWDGALHRAAALHAQEMAARESISHQYPGEADLAGRAGVAGAHFSFVAENVAMAPDAVTIHSAWMRSPHHRDNLLDPRADHVGISVFSRGNEIYAVEDFDKGVAAMSFDEQETAVAELLSAQAGLHIEIADPAARQTCEMNTGYAGSRRPWFVMRFTTGELNRLPEQLRTKLASGRYRQASVGACALRERDSFSAYNIAVLLYP